MPKLAADPPCPVVVLPGLGGGNIYQSIFSPSGSHPAMRFELIHYPPWARTCEPGFTADVLIDSLVTEIVSIIPSGPIRLMGISIGAQLGYAAAVKLQTNGRQIAGFCAVDSFMPSGTSLSPGWRHRTLERVRYLWRRRRLNELARFARSHFWRTLLRLGGQRVPTLVNKYRHADQLPFMLASDPIFERELSMCLLVRGIAPWITSLDRDPVPLRAPTALLRTTRLSLSDEVVWQRLCPEIRIINIPGDHDTFYESENLVEVRSALSTVFRSWCTNEHNLVD